VSRVPGVPCRNLQIVEKQHRLVGGEGGIRTLGTGYPVRQISKATPVRDQRRFDKTPQDIFDYGKMARQLDSYPSQSQRVSLSQVNLAHPDPT